MFWTSCIPNVAVSCFGEVCLYFKQALKNLSVTFDSCLNVEIKNRIDIQLCLLLKVKRKDLSQ